MPGALVIGESLIDVVNDGAQGVSILGVPDECLADIDAGVRNLRSP